jgi:hypothetical protein
VCIYQPPDAVLSKGCQAGPVSPSEVLNVCYSHAWYSFFVRQFHVGQVRKSILCVPLSLVTSVDRT